MTDSPFLDGKTAVRSDAAPPPAASRFAPGAVIAERFRIVSQLGRGGMGEVFRADDLKLGQSVALKFLPRELVHDRGRLEHLYAEVRIGRQVSHPNVCRLYDIFEWQDTHFIAMEYVDGEDLASLLRRIGRLPGDKALDIARDLSAGLAAAHDLGVIHRDLKPANVMIDGRGKARVTDFGLAVLAEQSGGSAGTPAYMSPEQLRGDPATMRSDLYALGLILFETFSGRRAFEGNTLDEIKQKRASGKTPSVSSVVRDIDPVVERVIARCLEVDPEARPSSAHAVIASLPGGDPLAAAVAAGETPSPEMVAAARESGALRPSVAWAMFATAVVAIVVIALMSNRSLIYRLVALPKSTEVLQARALEVAEHSGYSAPAALAGEWIIDDDFLDYLGHQKRSVHDWNTRPGVVRYVARLSPKEMRAWNPEARIMAFDPPLLDPGMIRVQLDPAGHLIELASVPPDKIDSLQGSAVDWNALFTEAGLDPGRFHSAHSVWSAPVDSDAKVAWDGTLAAVPGVPLHVEGASRASTPVWFKVFGPWDQPRSAVETNELPRRIAAVANLLLEVVPVLAGIFLAVGNLRRGRGDRRGAFRVAAFCFLTAGVANLFRADHGGFDYDEWHAIQISLGAALIIAATAWLMYVALEPYVRRKWPRLLISWTRLVSGRLRDPMVGRDVLIGSLSGLVLILLMHAARIVPQWFGIRNAQPMALATSPFASPKHVVYLLLYGASLFTLLSIELIALVAFLRLALRRPSSAVVVFFLMVSFAFSGAIRNGDVRVVVPYTMLCAAILTLVAVRYGLLALVTTGYFWGVLTFMTITVDTSTWYFGRSLLVMLVLGGIALWGAIVAIGDKPLFGAPLLDEG